VNLQLSNSFETSASYFNYDESELDTSLPAMFHEMEQPEFRGSVGRFWINMGTCDEIALDLLINALNNFSREYVGIRQVQVGGQSMQGWRAPPKASAFTGEADAARAINDSIKEDLNKIYPNQLEDL